MVVTDVILRHKLEIEVFTLDTQRLHADTLDVIAAISARYGYAVRVFHPDPESVSEYVATFGRDAFYESQELRKRCCHIRKVEPLNRALQGKEAWITGQRREHAVTRADLKLQEHDAARGIVKFNPLADWSEDDVWAYIRAFDVPYNALHDQGYRSIGCPPCPRPPVGGQGVRRRRWWGGTRAARERGLPVGPGGGRVRGTAARVAMAGW